jgi:FkbM family methyltransferase
MRVFAVEPSRTMCALIPELFRLRRESCPEILNCLLGSVPGRAYFLEVPENPGESRIVPGPAPRAYELPVRTLDEIVESLEHKPTFIKCDAEGAERAILIGGKRFLSEFHPKLAITTYHNDGDYAAVHSLLSSFGYNVAGKGFLFSPAKGTLRVQMIHAW